MSRWLEHSTLRSARRESSRELVSTVVRAWCAVSTSPRPTRVPCALIACARALSRSITMSARATTASPASDTLEHLSLAHPLDVLVDLQCRAQRVLEVALVAQRHQRLCPHDRLPDARKLVEVAMLAQAADRGHHADDDLFGHPGDSRADDLALAIGPGIVDPVV